MAIAFFDLDKTLLSVNSANLWVKREVREGYITRGQALRAGVWIVRYHLGLGAIEEAIGRAIETLDGVPEEVIQERTRRWYEEEVRGLYRPGARRAVAEHKERGDEVVLLTSSSPYVSAPVQEELELDGVLCTRFELVDGVFTGKPQLPLCYGQGKVHHAQRYADERDVALEDCAFYTDSLSDLPMLEVVGDPVVVHPDPRLARVAKKRGWPVVDWDA